MTGEGASCTESGLPGPTDGQPREEATWQASAVKRSSLGFIGKMLLGWQEHTCPPQERPPEVPVALGTLLGYGPCFWSLAPFLRPQSPLCA